MHGGVGVGLGVDEQTEQRSEEEMTGSLTL